MTKYLTTIFTFVVIGFLCWMLHDKNVRHKKELESLRKQHLREMNNEKARAEEWRQRALEYGNAFRSEATRATKAENNLSYMREENEKLKRRPVIRYNDSQLDSALSARYPK